MAEIDSVTIPELQTGTITSDSLIPFSVPGGEMKKTTAQDIAALLNFGIIGAVGNGIANDSAAVQNTINFYSSKKVSIDIIGNYNLNGVTINVPSNITLRFKGGSLINGKINSSGASVFFDSHSYVIFNNIEIIGYFNGSIYLSQNSNTDDDISFNNVTRFTTAYIDRDINLKRAYDGFSESNRRIRRSIKFVGLNSSVISYSNNYIYANFPQFYVILPYFAGSHHLIELDGITIIDTDYDSNLLNPGTWNSVVPAFGGSFSGNNSKLLMKNTTIISTGQCASSGSVDFPNYWQDIAATDCVFNSVVWPSVGTFNGSQPAINSRWRNVNFTNCKINNGCSIISNSKQELASESRCTWNSCELSGWYEYCSVGPNHSLITYLDCYLTDYYTSNTNATLLPRSNDYLYINCIADGDFAHSGANLLTLKNSTVYQRKNNSPIGDAALFSIVNSKIVIQGGSLNINNTIKDLSIKGLEIIHEDTPSGIPRLTLTPLKISDFFGINGSIKIYNKDYDFVNGDIIPKDVNDTNTITRFNDSMSRNDFSVIESFIHDGSFTKKVSLNSNTNVLVIQATIDVKGRFFNPGTSSYEGKVLLQNIVGGVTYNYGISASIGISTLSGETGNVHNGTISAGKALRPGIQVMTLYMSKNFLRVDVGGVTNYYNQYINSFLPGTNLSDCTLIISAAENVVHVSDVKILAL